MDCGNLYPWYVMEFDHRESRAKTGAKKIADLLDGSLESIYSNLASCDLVCANCHTVRTHLRAVAEGKRKQ